MGETDPPGIFLVNASGEMHPLLTESGYKDENLWKEVMDEQKHDFRCPHCQGTLRATNVEYIYPNDDDSGIVIPYSLERFSEYDYQDHRDQLYYCENGECPVERVTPGK